ncbi:dihydroxyacetone kinase subunit L [Photobacterium sp. DNB23_23_1]|uniref:Dihydroxyacetone kinase subunit L n=1 Tax=Photobacterium pectinilyticum TaxID=2906793 RepID=A0ABT1MYV3_9GAMM|nr:dihydroxyacetone kinase subunit L [Photobacterium sp. ZSDE20]MCQ1057665.1 dihydroxyacetone kinase subunit L [Photobacterium sp. ZSDE20]MDD1821930.1 dihydroxyacetone kinase subunit L [Photobacterium sp. ZSDE20]
MKTFNQKLLFSMLLSAAKDIRESVPLLNDLDGKTGDGDHGTTMLRVSQCIDKALANSSDPDWQKTIDDMGWSIMSQDGGSAGMLIGNLFCGLATGLNEPELTPQQTATAFRKGLDKLAYFSGAKAGDKTMLDALIPAVEVMEQLALDSEDIAAMFLSAAKASKSGAEKTKQMKPVRGRAKNMGEKAIGFVDPGATSISILFNSFSNQINVMNKEECYG